ncbi:MAG: PQQ-binding-like beta-propeller repeat protein [Candidatus Bathyarchaeia archaeon]|jgi:outer membrane protein assembly factor BamB
MKNKKTTMQKCKNTSYPNTTKNTNKMLYALALTLVLTLSSTLTVIPLVNSTAVPDRATSSFISVNPKVIGLNQDLTVNLWIYPPPQLPALHIAALTFENVTVTFTRPDGSKDTFMPVDGSGGLAPGQTETVANIWFLYQPDQIGEWSVTISFPGQTFSSGNDTVYYKPSTSLPFYFTVQNDPVQIGLPEAALPTNFWEQPINAQNREWWSISGDWLQLHYNGLWIPGSIYNPYSKAPNSPHIVWTTPIAMGGLTGGEWGGLSYASISKAAPFTIMQGKVYYNMPGKQTFRAYDLQTGEILWEKPGYFRLGQIERTTSQTLGVDIENFAGAAPVAYLWDISTSTWKAYDPVTGNVVLSLTNAIGSNEYNTNTGISWFNGSPIVFILQETGFNTTVPDQLAKNQLIRWDRTKVKGTDWSTGIVYNVSISTPGNPGVGDARLMAGLYTVFPYSDIGVVCAGNAENRMQAFNLTSGEKLWNKTVDYIDGGTMQGYESYGPLIQFTANDMTYHAYDINTGVHLWDTKAGENPWGSNPHVATTVFGNGKMYIPNYDGYVYAIDLKTGDLKWQSDYAGDTSETVFGTWSFTFMAGADGKIYAGQTRHTPTQPRARGNALVCIDENTGKYLWNVTGAFEPFGISNGYLIAGSEYDGLMYCFGKGQTQTTVSAPTTITPSEKSVLIQGTVTDQSPSQPGTPAVSDDSMSDWMNYLKGLDTSFINNPPTPKGVQVTLTAVDPNGEVNQIGTITTDANGRYATIWTPPSQGIYTIHAEFAGSESYWSSSAETSLGVGAVAAETTPISNEPVNDTMMTLTVGMGAAIIIAIAIATVLILRKRA